MRNGSYIFGLIFVTVMWLLLAIATALPFAHDWGVGGAVQICAGLFFGVPICIGYTVAALRGRLFD